MRLLEETEGRFSCRFEEKWGDFLPSDTLFAVLCTTVTLLCASPALAAPVEHDPVKTFARKSEVVAPPNLDDALASATPIEGPLKGIVFLAEGDTVLQPSAIAGGVDTTRVALLDDPAFAAKLAPYLGEPVSLKLIADIEAAVANWARRKGMPFVSVSTPEQEITGGVLQFRVQEFRVGKREAVAAGRMNPEQVLSGIRVQSGDTINSVMLAEDLNWLSRSPFRDVTADFLPGAAPGETDMTVRTAEARPLLATIGYDNTGARSTGKDRIRASLTLGELPVPGSVLTYQFAASPDAFQKGLAPLGGHASYQSHTLSAFVPTMPHQAFEATFDTLESNSTSSPFDIRSMITEGKLGYRMLASELGLPPGWGEVFGGIEFRRGMLESRFSGTLATSNAAEIAQFYAGWSNSFNDDNGVTNVSAEFRFSPGGLTSDNSGSAFSSYTSGRVTSATYAYGRINLERKTNLPYDLSLDDTIAIQLASGPLLDTEQLTMAGDSAVRGYLPDDGAYDIGIVSRNTLSYAPFDWNGVVTPFVLADFGVGQNLKTGARQTLASVGGGANFNIANSVTGTLSAAMALTDATVTKASDINITLRLGGQY